MSGAFRIPDGSIAQPPKGRNAPQEFREVAVEVHRLQEAILRANRALSATGSNAMGASFGLSAALGKSLEDCREDLEQLERLLATFRSLNVQSKGKSALRRTDLARHNIAATQRKLIRRCLAIRGLLDSMGAVNEETDTPTLSPPGLAVGSRDRQVHSHRGQYIGPGTDAKILRATVGPHTARAPSPLPMRTGGMLQDASAPSPDMQRGPPHHQGPLGHVDANLCPFLSCTSSFPGNGFPHLLDLEEHVRHAHQYTGELDLDATARAGHRPAIIAAGGGRTYAAGFAVEQPTVPISSSCPVPRRGAHGSLRSAGSPVGRSVRSSPLMPSAPGTGSARSFGSSPRAQYGSSTPTATRKRRPHGAMKAAEDDEPDELGDDGTSLPPRTSLSRSSSSSDRSPTSESSRTFDSDARSGPSGSEQPSRREQARQQRRRALDAEEQSRIQSLQETLHKAREDRDYYHRDRDYYKNLAQRHLQ